MNLPDLHVHSGYSTYDGFGSPQQIVERAKALGWGAVAACEHGWLGSAPALYQAANAAKIKPIIGCELYVTPDHYLIDGDKSVLKERRHLTVLALSLEGYQNLVAWVNLSFQRPLYYGGPRISIDRMIEHAPHPLHHNAILSGCLGGELCQCILSQNGSGQYAADSWVESMQSAFPNFYIEIQSHRVDKFIGQGFDSYERVCQAQDDVREHLLALASAHRIPIVVSNDSHYQVPSQRKAHLAMMARKQHRNAAEAHRARTPESLASTFASEYVYWSSYLQPIEPIIDVLPSWAAKSAADSIAEIVEEADVRLDPLDKFSYALPRSPYRDPLREIRKRSARRLKGCVARHGSAAAERFEYELQAMEGFAHYLLIYSDIVRMARSQGVYTWTRGSAANSLVNFCLGIHEIDPIYYKLAFERFVNPARAKFPDVDIDIEGTRRDDVAKMVTEYMAEVEGEGNVLPVCTYSTLSNRASFRLAAEAAGVPKERIDQLSKLIPDMIDSGMVESDEQVYETLREELGIDLYADAAQLFDSIGGVSQHACAYAIGTESRPLADWVPTYRIGSSNALVTQYNMKWIEELGFLKLDLLKLDSLAIMHQVARLIGKDMRFLDEIVCSAPGIYDQGDAKTWRLLRQGRTAGVHTFQGNSQRRGLIDVIPESDHDLVAVQALFRPSGTRSDLDKRFVARRHEREEWQSLNSLTAKFTDETYGVTIYQEQIMEMGAEMGMSGEEIDDLYKAIKTAKGLGRGAAELFDKFEPTFRKYANPLMPKNEADELWNDWHRLQGYTFNRGHATSYAILGLKMAWLKAHYPQEFFVSLLDRYPTNGRYLAAAIEEGFQFERPDINQSAGGFTRGADKRGIRVGLLRVSGLGPGAVGEIVRNQPFGSLDDLRGRTDARRVDKTVVENLGRLGALQSVGIAGDHSDLAEFELLGFTLDRPRAMRGCSPQIRTRSTGSTWRFRGLEKGVQITEGKSFVAKMFWLPDVPDNFTTKTSATGRYNAHLLSVVDENGMPFDIVVGEEKETESKMIKLLAKRAKNAVVTLNGKVNVPFRRGGDISFSLWGIEGAEDGNPQCWGIDKELAKMLIHLAQEKHYKRRKDA